MKDIPISLLVLTHGHFDHVWDAAEIARIHDCPVAMHATTEEMLADRNLLRRFGLDLEVEPVAANQLLEESKGLRLLGHSFDVLEVPGHCPGSLCLHSVAAGMLFGGDVLFAGGVGRWDLPGGDRDLLLRESTQNSSPCPPPPASIRVTVPPQPLGRSNDPIPTCSKSESVISPLDRTHSPQLKVTYALLCIRSP